MAAESAQINQQQLKLTEEELSVLRQCNQESFMYRSLPLAALFGTLAHIGVKNGYFRPSVRWGSAPKVVGFGFIGYFIGKFSYVKTCQEKFINMPNSRLGAVLRQQRGGPLNREMYEQGSSQLTIPSLDIASSPDTIQEERAVDLNMNVGTPHEGDISWSDRDDQLELKEDLTPAESFTTYEELRRKNRAELESRPSYRTGLDSPLETSLSSSPKLNKYGDEWVE